VRSATIPLTVAHAVILPHVKDVLGTLVGSAPADVEYVDARHVRSRRESISTRNGRVDDVTRLEDEGIGVRALVGGAWGFAAARDCRRAAAEGALARAIEIARAQPAAAPVRRTSELPARGTWASDAARDPFAVSLDDKLAILLAADEALRGDARIAVTGAHFAAIDETRTFASSEGALLEQRSTECGGGIEAVAVSAGETQVRSYPASFRGDVAQAGYEYFEGLALATHAPVVAEEAIALLTAPPCEPGRTDLVLNGQQVALQLHESVGHAVELDRVLGGEASYAGTSFLSPADLGRFRYGSELMNVSADAGLAGGLGSFAWDDEGVEAQATAIVTDGTLTGFLTSRETAAAIGLERSGGCMRAQGFARQPIVRMTNVSLAPGDAGSLDDLIASTERGLYLDTNRSWSIDSRRLHFQFATEAAWEIVDGERTRLVRNPSYAGVTPDFWSRLDAICSPGEWRPWGVLNCGKGEPGQSMHVSHGTAPARFRDVMVGVA
jgi:TldD protein